MLACDIPQDYASELLSRTSSAYVTPVRAVRTDNAHAPKLWSASRGVFPPATIAELQRWGQFVFDHPNQRLRAFWSQLCESFGGTVPLPLALPGAEPDSVQLAWDTDAHHLDVTILADGAEEWFFMDRETGELVEGALPNESSRFAELLRKVADG